MKSTVVRVAALGALLAFGACQKPTLPMEAKAPESGTGANIAGWRSGLEGLSPAQSAALDTAVQELRLKLMTDGVSGSDAINAALADRVGGKTVAEIIQLGFAAKLGRLEAQRQEVDTLIAENAKLETRPDDMDSAEYLAKRRDEQNSRRGAVDREIKDAQDQLKSLGLSVPPPEPAAAKSPGALEKAPAPADQKDASEVGPQRVK